MVKVLIVEKNCNIKSTELKTVNVNELYKKCGFKTDEHFKERACWNVKIDGEENVIKCFAKDEGRANMENKYDLPPPIDSALYFGTIAVVKMEGDEFKDLTIDLWNKVYEKLFGGFEDLAATAEEDEKEVDELDSVPEEMKTKHGYLKDGFVVDSEEDEDDEDEDAEEEDSWGDEGSELDYEEYEYSDDE